MVAFQRASVITPIPAVHGSTLEGGYGFHVDEDYFFKSGRGLSHELVDAIIASWQRDRPLFPNYAAGSSGPKSADAMMARDGRAWRRP